jgi:sec-independent protein translocase protein TatC
MAAFGFVLGMAGLAFGYGILLPRAIHFLTGYDTTHFRLLIRASSYYSFVVTVLLGIVCVFETPLVVLALVNLGVLSSRTLRRNRRKGYFIVSVIALALPGPDPVTTLLELLPMLMLFEGSIWLAAYAERRAARLSVAGAQA